MSVNQLSKFRQFGKKIIGFGMTYREHAAEMNDAVPKEPLAFFKPTSSYITEGETIKLPPGVAELHHEVELGVIIGKPGRSVPESVVVEEYIGGYVLALDMTDRNEQSRVRKAGLPWTLAKGFDTACPVSQFLEKSAIPDPHNVNLWLKVNGLIKQKGSTAEMAVKIPYLISWISHYITLEPGDLILTGTPSGVGPVRAGDRIECGLDKLITMTFDVEARVC